MATYVPGVPQYLPNFTPFTPDYKFLSNVLDTKTQKYNSNYKALNDLYSKVVYGDLSRKDTKAMREQFTQNLGPRLEQISGMDLSMMQNAEAAKSIFKPFFEEDLIVKDLVTTKIYREEMKYVDALKNSPDLEQRTMYWREGIQKMQYEMEDFVNATEEEALKMAAPKYVPDADLTEAAVNFLEESGLKHSSTEPSKDGLWMIKREQGDLVTREGLQMVQTALMDDPRVIEAYHAKAFVDSRQAADKGVKEGKYQTINEGQVAWAADKISDIEAKIAKRTVKLEEEEVDVKNTSVAWEVYRKQNGIVKGSKEDKKAKESWSRIKAIRAEIGRNKDALSGSKTIDASNPEELVPENKQKLLYRAYGLMMNYNMQSDLQAGAIQYSNIGKKIDIEVNPYGKMRVQNQYDMTKMRAQSAYTLAAIKARGEEDRKTIDYELSQTGAAIGNLDFLGNLSETHDGVNTIETQTDENGNFDPNHDYIGTQQEKILGRDVTISEKKIDLALAFLHSTAGQGNNNSGNFKVEGMGDAKSLTELSDMMKTKNANGDGGLVYQNEINAFYDKMHGVMNNVEADLASLEDGIAPNLVTERNVDNLSAYRKQFFNIDQADLALTAGISEIYSVLDNNLGKAMATGYLSAVDEGNVSEFSKILEGGIPSLFYKEKDAKGKLTGLTKMYTDVEYRKAFSDWSQSSANNVNVKDTYFDDSGYLSSDKSERTQNENDEYSKLGYGQTATITKGRPNLKGGGRQPDSYSYSGDFSFQQDMANEQADVLYGIMKNLTNHSANGGLETIVDPQSSAGPQSATYTKQFDSPDLDQIFRGIDASQMNPGDVNLSAQYTMNIDPLQINQEGAEMIKLFHDLNVKNSPTTHVYIDDVSFNKTQVNESYGWFGAAHQDQDSEILDPSDGDGAPSNNFPKGKQLLTQWMQDVYRMQGKSPTKADYPGATVKYYSSWTADANNFDHKYAGYTIEFDQDYLDQYRKPGQILEGLKGTKGHDPYILNIVIPKNDDYNPRKSGQMNFSSVATQISASDNSNYKSVIPLGGSLSVIMDNVGQYNISYDIQQFDAKTGGWDSENFSEIMRVRDKNSADYGQPITQADRRYLDYYTNEYVNIFQRVSKSNIKDKNAWVLKNPDKMVSDPIYRYE
jgi:hypothetical protein